MGALKNMIFPKIKTPKLEPAARMPDLLDPAIIEARKKKLAEMGNRGGRANTVLTDYLGSTGKVGA